MMEQAIEGLTLAEVKRRRARAGPNEIEHRKASLAATIGRGIADPVVLLLLTVAGLSVALGQHTDASIVFAIVLMSVGLSAGNEYRAERVLEDLQKRMQRRATVLRDGRWIQVAARELVPGDAVRISSGDILPADIRIESAESCSCNESTLTGEAAPVPKAAGDLAFMGTVAAFGIAYGIVTRTGADTQYGQIARQAAQRTPPTQFQAGLRRLSTLLAIVTAGVAVAVLLYGVLGAHRSLWISLLFALAIAVSLTPQLLPAIVSVSLAAGARSLAARGLFVKRLIAIEDLGNVQILFTDKTGTLTEGEIEYTGADGSDETLLYGLLCSSAVRNDGTYSGNDMDVTLWRSAPPCVVEKTSGWKTLDERPFDYDRRFMSVLAGDGSRTLLLIKGAPENVIARCDVVTEDVRRKLEALLSGGERVLAVASKAAASIADENSGFRLCGFLRFSDPVRSDAGSALQRLKSFDVIVKIVTGDSPLAARSVCAAVGIDVSRIITGDQLESMSDRALEAALPETTIFARTNPTQKARIVAVQRHLGADVAYLGDGINDVPPLHHADVGISVRSASDVAKDAADVILMTKDLDVLASGILEGRRVFVNTVKYVLMAVSSNFGNMISTAIGSIILPFLPLLPSQILLNNLLYDASELTIPSDRVDDELLRRPAHWDMRMIRRFMIAFGPVNAAFDLTIFAVMAWFYHVAPAIFRTGFFVESFVTQTIVIFALRTRRPFLFSRPSRALFCTTLAAAGIGIALPFTPLGAALGFAPIPASLAGIIAALIVLYVFAVEGAKRIFYRGADAAGANASRTVSLRS